MADGIVIFRPGDPDGRVIWLHDGAESAELVWNRMGATGLTLIACTDMDWNRDLTPWPGEKVFRGGEHFAGGAPAYLQKLTERILETESKLGFSVRRRCIAGYSLAGLFAVWAVHRCELFDGAVSASGSLWYDGFTEFLRENTPHTRLVYLSVGDREKSAKNPRMAKVEDCIRLTREIFESRGVRCVFELNEGGHFHDAPGRLARGIQWMEEYL